MKQFPFVVVEAPAEAIFFYFLFEVEVFGVDAFLLLIDSALPNRVPLQLFNSWRDDGN